MDRTRPSATFRFISYHFPFSLPGSSSIPAQVVPLLVGITIVLFFFLLFWSGTILFLRHLFDPENLSSLDS